MPQPQVPWIGITGTPVGGGMWNQNFDGISYWILIYTKAQELSEEYYLWLLVQNSLLKSFPKVCSFFGVSIFLPKQ